MQMSLRHLPRKGLAEITPLKKQADMGEVTEGDHRSLAKIWTLFGSAADWLRVSKLWNLSFYADSFLYEK